MCFSGSNLLESKILVGMQYDLVPKQDERLLVHLQNPLMDRLNDILEAPSMKLVGVELTSFPLAVPAG